MFAVDTPGGRFCFLCAYIIFVNLSGLHLCAIHTHDVDVSDSSYKNMKGKKKTRKRMKGLNVCASKDLKFFFRDLSLLLIPRIYISILTWPAHVAIPKRAKETRASGQTRSYNI